MSDAFDPYYAWLAIPPDEQPPDHYRLLGARKYEANLDVISNAADQRMAHVRTFQSGKHGNLSQRLLNELAAARVLLLVPEKKAAYDAQLRAAEENSVKTKHLPRAKPLESPPCEPAEAAPVAVAMPLPQVVMEKPVATKLHSRPSKPRQNPLIWAVAGGAGLLILVIVVAAVMKQGITEPEPVTASPDNSRTAKSELAQPSTRQPRNPLADAQPINPSGDEAPSPPSRPEAVARPTLPIGLSQSGGDAVNLVDKIDARESAGGRGRIEIIEGKRVRTGLDAPVLVPIDYELPESYVIEATATRRGGNEVLGLGLVIGGQQTMLDIDGFANHGNYSGFDAIDNLRPPQSGYPGAFKGPLLTNGRPARIRVVVSKNAASATCDGKEFFSWEGDPKRLSVIAFRPPAKPGLFLVTWGTDYEVADFKLFTSIAGTVARGDAPPAQAINLLDINKFDLGKGGASSGEISVTDGQRLVLGRATPGIAAMLADVPRQYAIEATITRLEGDAFALGLVVGGFQTMLAIDGYASHGHLSGLDQVNGRPPYADGYERPYRGLLLTNGKAAKLRVVVLENKVTAFCDGKEFYQWTGNPSELSFSPLYKTRSTTGLFVAAWDSKFDITELKLVTLENLPPLAQVEPTRPAPAATKPPAIASPTPAVAIERAPLPEVAAREAARKEARRILKDEFEQAKKPSEKLALSQRLRALASESQEDPATGCALYEEAIRLAIEAVQWKDALAIIEEQATKFDVDVLQVKGDALKTMAPLARTTIDRSQVAEAALQIANEAVARENFDTAEQLLRMAASAAARSGDTVLRGEIAMRTRQIDELQRRTKLAEAAQQRLQTEPENAKANLVYGKYLCFMKRSWKEGLPCLAKGDDAELKAIAELDGKQPADAEEQADLAEGWWDVAQKLSAEEKPGALLRARYWYQTAEPRLAGLRKARAMQRLEAIASSLPAELKD